MAYDIGFMPSLCDIKPDNHGKAIDFTGNSAKKSLSFRDVFDGAVRKRDQNNIIKEPVQIKRSKDEADSGKDLKQIEESKEKHEVKKAPKADENVIFDEISLILKEMAGLMNLADLMNLGGVSESEQVELQESMEAVMKELAEIQKGGMVPRDSDLYEGLAELVSTIEMMRKELESCDSSAGRKSNADFMKKLETETAKVFEKIKTSSERPTGINASEQLNPKAKLSIREPAVINAEAGENQKKDANFQKSEGSFIKGIAAEQEAESKAVQSEEDVKVVLDSKTEKVNVEAREGKYGKNQDIEKDVKKEASKVYKTSDTVQSRQVDEEMAAHMHEQKVTENGSEAVRYQAVPPKSQPVNKSEIINQIVKKAEIILNELQSEMSMQLEPENLGKLTLKVAVEKGLITAKFVAESNEVKQVIESSFNELKDMLQEKGLLIQNLSVSVGQNDNNYNYGNNFYQWEEKVLPKSRSVGSGSYYGFQDGELTVSGKVNPYSIHNGEFDHRA